MLTRAHLMMFIQQEIERILCAKVLARIEPELYSGFFFLSQVDEQKKNEEDICRR